jgi:hypothetical protein
MARWIFIPLLFASAAMAQGAAPASAHADLLKQLAANEDATWHAFENRDLPALRRAFAPGFVFVDPDGAIGTEELLKFAAVCDERSWSFDRQQLIPISDDAVQTIFYVTQDTSCGGKPAPKHIYLNITWVLQQGRWLELVHSEIPAAKN